MIGFLARLFVPKAAVWIVSLLSVTAVIGVGVYLVQHGKKIGFGVWAKENQRIDETTLESKHKFDARTASDDTEYRRLIQEIGR